MKNPLRVCRQFRKQREIAASDHPSLLWWIVMMVLIVVITLFDGYNENTNAINDRDLVLDDKMKSVHRHTSSRKRRRMQEDLIQVYDPNKRNLSDDSNSNDIHQLVKLGQSDTIIENKNNKKNVDKEDDDSNKRDEICRAYLVNFLNGTTDFKDECQGFYNAFKAANCEGNTHASFAFSGSTVVSTDHALLSIVGRKHSSDNGAVADDDLVIDDDYENFQCCSVISGFYEKHCSAAMNSSIDPTKLLGIVMVLVVCGLVKSLLRYAKIQFIPDAGACIIVGAVVGLLIQIFHYNQNSKQNNQDDIINDELSFNNDLFLRILLPPIIFEASLTIDKRSFRRDLFPILTFSIFGTAMSALFIGYGTYYICNNVWHKAVPLPLLDSLLFGSLMSSIDPVATLSILAGVGIQQTDPLYTLIFGESLLNDGVSIVLFDSLVEHMGDSEVVDAASFHDTIADFFIVTTGSILIGSVCGAAATLYFWMLSRKQNDVTEVALFFAWALIPYYIADKFQYSGIISIMVMGFVMDYYVIGGFQSEHNQWMEYMELRRQRNDTNSSNTHRSTTTATGPSEPTTSNHIADDFVRNGTSQDYPHLSSTTPPVEPCFDRIRLACFKAFSGRGHLMNRSKHHVGFVAEVIANVMETSIFAYLGLFLFNDRAWNLKMLTSGLFSCIASRAVMVFALSSLINVCVLMDLEVHLGRLWRKLWMACKQLNGPSNLSPSRRSFLSFNDDDDDDEDYAVYSNTAGNSSRSKHYLNPKMQLILFSAGIRGAVSYALVQNIPVYDAVTKTGSHFKGELRAMTSATIMILLFTLGAVTYFTVTKSNDPLSDNGDEDDVYNQNHYQGNIPGGGRGAGAVGGNHSYQLMTNRTYSALDSAVGEEVDSSDLNSLLLEASMEERRRRPHLNDPYQQNLNENLPSRLPPQVSNATHVQERIVPPTAVSSMIMTQSSFGPIQTTPSSDCSD